MNARSAGIVVVMFLLAVVAGARPSARVVSYPQSNVEILVGGVAVPAYPHDGRWYVEAVKGREYAIRLRNPFPTRVAVALSVDGLNTIDARQSSASGARKWVIDPYQSITISGWQTSTTEARRFEFTTEETSYGQALGRTANLGIISAVFFKERTIATPFESRDDASRRPEPATPQAGAARERADAASSPAKVKEEYAATGMGRPTGHAVTHIRIDLEPAPAQVVDIRYEFRPQLVRLGVLPAAPANDSLDRRERARGFDQGFSPVPPGVR